MITRTVIAAVALSIASHVCAQDANEGIKGLEACFQVARLADAICSSPANDSVQRLDCFQKTRAAQLECLQHVPLGVSADSKAPEVPKTASPQPGGTIRSEGPVGSVGSPNNSVGRDAPTKKTAGPGSPISPGVPAETVSSEAPTGTISSPTGPVSPPPPDPAPSASATPNVQIDKPSAPQPVLAKEIDNPSKSSNASWVISETTSPVDYGVLVTATIHSISNAKDAASTLIFRCHALQTELSVRMELAWSEMRSTDAQVEYRVNDQPPVRSKWALSADRKTLTYGDDGAGLLRSLPEGTKFKINVPDKPGFAQESTFQLNGLDIVRKKIAAACKWAPTQDALSTRNR
jgi:hypothetical protein